MGCYPLFFFTIAIFLVICYQKHIPLLHSEFIAYIRYFPVLSILSCACINSSMFSFQGAVCTKIDVDGCKNAIEPPQQALFLQYSVDFCIGKCVTDLPQLEFDAILILVQGTV